MTKITLNVCDHPVTEEQADALNITKYTKGLVQFIRHCDTPMTISIQGEWGSGKTSLINLLNSRLEKEFNTYVINTWENSLVDPNHLSHFLFKDFISLLNVDNDMVDKTIQFFGSLT